MESPTARPIEKKEDPKEATRTTATIEEIKCPPTRFRGCDIGPSGAANRRTAVAPKEPMSKLWPVTVVIQRIDHIESELLIKLQMANLRDRSCLLVKSGALSFPGNFLILPFNVSIPNHFHLIYKTKN